MSDLQCLIYIPLAAVGFIVLNSGAQFITDNAIALSKRLGISRFVIGMLVVSTLAAMPEVMVSMFALAEGADEIALGNGLASNVVTIAFVIGLAAVIAPLKVSREMVTRDAVFLMTVTIVCTVLLLDGDLTTFEGIALMILFVPYTVNLLLVKQGTDEKVLEETIEEASIQLELMGHLFGKKVEIRAGLNWLVFGILWTVLGAEFVVRSIMGITDGFAVDPWLMGITVAAIGTTLPDMAAALHAAKRGYPDLALGEGIGASIVTVLLTLGLIGLISPMETDTSQVMPILAVLNFATFLVLVFMLKTKGISQVGGYVLMSTYFGMVLSIILLGIW